LAVFTVLLNALLTLIAGSRLWSHIFWRGTAEKAALPPSPMMATWILTIVVVVLGLAPAILVEAATIAARDLLDPARYIASVGLSP
ncbi:MAG: hypothetical protein J0I48_09420, partial [Devosia sp.]|nr:hypothetical protein [Devosia sp.]